MNNKKNKIDVFRYELIFLIITIHDFYGFIIQGFFTNNGKLFIKAIIYYLIAYIIIYILRKLLVNYDLDFAKELQETRNNFKSKIKTIKKMFINKIIKTIHKLEN